MKKLMIVMMALVTVLSMVAGVSAQAFVDDCIDCAPVEDTPSQLDVASCEVEVNGDEVLPNELSSNVVNRGEEMDIKVRLKTLSDVEDVQITAILTGYNRREQLVDMTRSFDLKANDKDTFNLRIKIPEDWDVEGGDDDIVYLRIIVSDDSHDSYIRNYKLRIKPNREQVVIKDIITEPYDAVEAGRGLFASVRVKNFGQYSEEDIKIQVSIPELGVKAFEYIDELETDESITSEDMFLRIPACAEPGEYTLKATVDYAYGDERVTSERTILVKENADCESNKAGSNAQTVVTVPGKQDVIKGTTGTVYPVIIQNSGASDKAYELSVAGLDTWATYRFDPGAFVLVKSGEMETVFLHVTANEDAAAGEKVFMVNVKTTGDEKQIALSANVVAGDTEEPSNPFANLGDLRKGLEVGVIVLVVLLVVLGLIVGFSKMKGNDGDDEEVSGQTYY